MIGEVSNKKIYDIGCGNGYIDRILAEKGASKIFASDISSELIEIAKQKPHKNIEYFTSDGQDFNYFSLNESESFDLIISNRDKITEVIKNFASPFEEIVYWGEMELYIQKRSISYYINTINKAGFLLESFQEISKLNQEGDQILDTKIPQSMAFCFVKR